MVAINPTQTPDKPQPMPPVTPRQPRCYVFVWTGRDDNQPIPDGLHRFVLALCEARDLGGPFFIADRPTRRLFEKVAPSRGDHVLLLASAFPTRRRLARAVSFCLGRGTEVHLFIADKPFS